MKCSLQKASIKPFENKQAVKIIPNMIGEFLLSVKLIKPLKIKFHYFDLQ